MREYGSVHTCFWAHVSIQSLSDQSKLLAVYLLTGPHTNMLGCFRLPIGYISEDLNWRTDIAIKRLEELFQIGFAHYDSLHHWIMMPQFLTWNPVENPNQGKSIRRLFEQVPKKTGFFAELIQALLTHDKYLEEHFKEALIVLSQTSQKVNSSAAPNVVCGVENKPVDQSKDCSREADKASELDSQILPVAILPSKAEQPVIHIALNDRSEFPIMQCQIDEWQLLYPAVDVLQVLRNIRAWNQANPTRRKTKSGILRHIVAWLSKEQNQSKSPHANVLIREPVSPVYARNLATASHWLNESYCRDISEIPITTTHEENR